MSLESNALFFSLKWFLTHDIFRREGLAPSVFWSGQERRRLTAT